MFVASYDHEMLHQINNIPRSLIMDHNNNNIWSSNNGNGVDNDSINVGTEKIAPNCPRCASSNTKFCYYNNYSLSQPRYFCKGCKRYWTKGGSLRNVPVGGGCRKNRRSKSARLRSSSLLSSSTADGFHSKQDHLFQSITNHFSSSPESDSFGGSSSSSSSNHIDLAAVFAKYLVNNNDDATGHKRNGDLDMIESREPSDLTKQQQQQQAMEITDHDHGKIQNQEVNTLKKQESVENDQFGLLSLLEEEVMQDVLWSNEHEDYYTANTCNQSFSSQPIIQMQDIDLFRVDDQNYSSKNLVLDNWSSFDLSGFEIFSKP